MQMSPPIEIGKLEADGGSKTVKFTRCVSATYKCVSTR